MKKLLKDESGFTLIEMLIVLLAVSILLFLFVPNLGSRRQEISNQGVQALHKVIETQVELYLLEKGNISVSFDILEQEKYLSKDQVEQAKKFKITINNNKVVINK